MIGVRFKKLQLAILPPASNARMYDNALRKRLSFGDIGLLFILKYFILKGTGEPWEF